MLMDEQLSGYYCGSINGTKYVEEAVPFLSDHNFVTGFNGSGGSFLNHDFLNIPPFPPDPHPDLVGMPSGMSTEGDSHDDCDFSDGVLKFINRMLMEEDMEEKTCMFQESAALQAAEKSFYEVLVVKEGPSPSPDHHQIHHVEPDSDDPNECYGIAQNNNNTSSGVIDQGLTCDHVEYKPLPVQTAASEFSSQSTSQSSFSSSSSVGSVIDALTDSPVSTLGVHDIFNDTNSFSQYQRGFEEASKFLPRGNGLSLDSGNNNLVKEEKEDMKGKGLVVKAENNYEREYSLDGSRGKKNAHRQEFDLEEGRSNKQSALYTETSVTSEMFDRVLLCSGEKNDESALREALQNAVNKNMQQNGPSKGLNSGRARGRKKGGKRDVVDLTTLLTLCAQAVSANDRRSASELLKQIRQHASPVGDGMQRMAHYFADGLEARMAGSGTQSYRAVITKLTSAAEILKAYHLYLACCPFKKVSNFFANRTIMNVSEKATRLHIVDFGILYGFQYPSLIQRLSFRPGGPPKVRITGIDLPNSGFRPAERVEETGRRLANYAKSFNVPFDFNAIAQKWETIQIEDLKLDRDEVLVVNCQYRFRNLLDETVVMESPREIALKLIRKMNPDVYLQGVVNGSYNAPFFISRFREAMFHYSSFFDMLETTVPREVHERMLIEKEIFGWEAMNVISCEGAERIERPETYKQWQVRNLRAGFKQLPLDREIMRTTKEKVNAWYNKDFVVDEDGEQKPQCCLPRLCFDGPGVQLAAAIALQFDI
ncbi:hypothetical protein RHMOL_Rhmol03G0153500 [Rhododendron molle]|uniref:Uncharacterized protein n=1 Tax=Rhododendron molle TaxID=49168 RepID=A0ACC0PER1_RHOML|nr:hypothetical protein RHMOL_Rhmol03G0153500 [Rhododendron molle]